MAASIQKPGIVIDPHGGMFLTLSVALWHASTIIAQISA
jgi:hypothetical protein